ncbi:MULTISPECIES: NAD-dependent epimerase/dehydratase family protein [Flavobacteriaceae]|uniref:NAD-dependent epimerase/dehydratase family protein n=1 Tax=Flavobacteriaceae TaxID=49546 RepID=UPI001490FBB0|nr:MULTISPECIES: NAD-dependent epimerase/dehydratase family protein [Allomuricauda]MDC6365473.1 NAD-dependent epimerase/dehydratase family protein [Muricauda sp. AC10]
MVLVTGGTGLIGSHLLFQLLKNGEKVRALYRNEKSKHNVEKVFGYYSDKPSKVLEQIEWVQADITDIDALSYAFVGIEYVYHAAALISFDPHDYNSLKKINIEGTANVVNLCLKYGVKKLCYVSSIAAVGPSIKGNLVTEENEWNETGVSVYGLTKHDAELEVWRGSQEGLPVVIVNPGVVIGPGFWKTGSGSFFTYAAKGKKSFLPGGTGFVSINDVVTAMISLQNSKINRERFILVSENLSYGQLFQKIALEIGKEPPSKQIPFWLLEFLWRLDWLRSSMRGKRRRLPKAVAKGLYHQEYYSSEKLKQSLDFNFVNLDEALKFCASRYREERL